jgi:hypothetical protein
VLKDKVVQLGCGALAASKKKDSFNSKDIEIVKFITFSKCLPILSNSDPISTFVHRFLKLCHHSLQNMEAQVQENFKTVITPLNPSFLIPFSQLYLEETHLEDIKAKRKAKKSLEAK